MTIWNIHLLNARHELTRILPEIRAAARESVAVASALAALPDFDLVVKSEPGGGIPVWGIGGLAPSPGLIEITVDPARFSAELFIRTLVHEMHHLIRWDGPGYGRSLGEALVSEGLAGHFVLATLGGQADPWNATHPAEGVMRQAMNEWSRLDYDHARWFFGGGDLRKWTGYGLGHRLIGTFLAANAGETTVTLANAPAGKFRQTMQKMARAEAPSGAEDMPAGPDQDQG